MIKFFNTLTKSEEEFKPIEKQVRMYNCGPTVYDYVHIGNLRSVILADTIRRVLEFNGYSVKQVMNITDVGHLTSDADSGDDKMMKGLKREGKEVTLESLRELSEKYTVAFVENTESLNTETPHVLPRASEHVEEQIEMIKTLESKHHTYVTSDGVYFDTSTVDEYGKLGGLSEMQESRIGKNAEKKNSRDFALWKFNDELGWESSWGKGFPGWHIECSAMSREYLGDTFDIHTGGVDNIPTHHNNEIAQSESANEKPFANFWLHNEHLLVNGGKMAKSEGTGFTLAEIVDRGFTPLAFRYWLLTGHYRSKVNFTWEALGGAQSALNKLYSSIQSFGENSGDISSDYLKKFQDAVNDDLGTPQAIAVMWSLVKNGDIEDEDKRATLLKFDEVLGLDLKNIKQLEIPTKVRELIAMREEARAKKDWPESDRLRDLIKEVGFEIKDTEDGPTIEKESESHPGLS